MKRNLKPIPKINSIRILEKFAWLPIEIGNEIRWLEKVRIEQIYLRKVDRVFIGCWSNVKFLPKADADKNVLRELGKEHFKELLSQEHPSIKYGDELIFGMRYYGKDGKIASEIVETIHKNDL